MKVLTGAAALGFFAFFFSASSRLSIALRRSANTLFSIPLRLSCPERFSPPGIFLFCFTRRSTPFLRSVVVRLSPPRLLSAIILTTSDSAAADFFPLSEVSSTCVAGISCWVICPAGLPFAFIRDASSGFPSGVGVSFSISVFSLSSSIASSISCLSASSFSSLFEGRGVSSTLRDDAISNFFAALINLFCVIPFTFSDSAIIRIPFV